MKCSLSLATIASVLLLGWSVVTGPIAVAQEKPKETEAKKPAYQPSEEVKQVLTPLFSRILKADVSRATVELSAETVMGGEVVETVESTYQIASKYPDRYTVYFKSDEDRKRLYSDGKEGVVALTPEAFYRLPRLVSCQELATRPEINLGPYPEVVLALTLAGVDPAVTFLGGMKSVEIVSRSKYRGSVQAVQLRGQQKDGVSWNLWITDDDRPRPLRLLVDLTPMLVATGQVAVPQGYAYSLRYDFKSWRVSGEVDDKLFQFAASENAVEYESLEDYRQKKAAELEVHPLLGKKIPSFDLQLLDGDAVSIGSATDKVIVLDFWATWCGPCMKAMPVIESLSQQYADKGVEFYAVNVGESSALVKGFVGEQGWDLSIATDPNGETIEAFSAKSIPLTLLIAPTGIVEAVHQGFPGPDELNKQFRDELDVLIKGGRIASSDAADN